MFKREAVAMLREAFGPGDLAVKLNQTATSGPGDFGLGEWTIQDAEKLIDWIAEQLADEEE